MKLIKPFNLAKWLEENRHLLKPPVSNKNLYVESEDYIVMVVGGPNARKDYHYNESEELFYQLEGIIQVAVQTAGGKETMTLGHGDMFILPAKIPHSPIRTEGSVGLVIERKRDVNNNAKDVLLWYCDQCNEKLYEVYFPLHNIETDFLNHFQHFYESEELRTCKKCGHTMEVDNRFVKK